MNFLRLLISKKKKFAKERAVLNAYSPNRATASVGLGKSGNDDMMPFSLSLLGFMVCNVGLFNVHHTRLGVESVKVCFFVGVKCCILCSNV